MPYVAIGVNARNRLAYCNQEARLCASDEVICDRAKGGYSLNVLWNLDMFHRCRHLFNERVIDAWTHIDAIIRICQWPKWETSTYDSFPRQLGGVSGLLTEIRMSETGSGQPAEDVKMRLYAQNEARRDAALLLNIIGDDEASIESLQDLEAAFVRVIDAKIDSGDFESAAIMSILLLGDINRALQCLYDSEQERLLFIATILAGHYSSVPDSPSTDKLFAKWKDLCTQLLKNECSVYQKFFYSYIIDGFQLKRLLFELSELPLKLRIAGALRIFSPEDLALFTKTCLKDAVEHGDLCEGLLLAGLSPMFIDVAESFVDQTADIQTATLLTSLVANRYYSDTRLEMWYDLYRELLNRWRLFPLRCAFDMARQKCCLNSFATGLEWPAPPSLSKTGLQSARQRELLRVLIPVAIRVSGSTLQTEQHSTGHHRKSNPQQQKAPTPLVSGLSGSIAFPASRKKNEDWHEFRSMVRCQYCGNGVTLSSFYTGSATGSSGDATGKSSRFSASASGSSNPSNPGKYRTQTHSCPHCKKSLPLCSVCSLSWGSLAVGKEFSDKEALAARQYFNFLWCSKCFHGGHLSHLSGWFQKHSTCPVSGCNCFCNSQV